jgi:putative endonuclease
MSSHWFTYVVRCADGSLYASAAPDVERAAAALNGGTGSAWVRARLPVSVAHVEEYMNERDAVRRAEAVMRMTRAGRERLVGAEAAAVIGELGFAS